MIPIFRSIISCSLSPNVQNDDVKLALRMLFNPARWHKGPEIDEVKKWFREYFDTDKVYLSGSGRASLSALLFALGVKEGDEVIVQAFSCVAVADAVLWAKAKPIFADIDKNYNIDPASISKLINSKTKAIIVQHTFGVPADMRKIIELSKRNHLLIIEDCAHALGAMYENQKVGSLGDAAIFSFGRDKVISSVWGGAAIINKKCPVKNCREVMEVNQAKLQQPSSFWIFQQLFHPIAFSIILKSYNMWIGKIILIFFQKIKLLTFPIETKEKSGLKPTNLNYRYPNALAGLILNQLRKLESYNGSRRMIAEFYFQKLSAKTQFKINKPGEYAIYLRYPVEVQNPDKLYLKAKSRGIILGNWYHNVIDPAGVDFNKIYFSAEVCPKATAAAKKIINLPTRITKAQAQIVIDSLL